MKRSHRIESAIEPEHVFIEVGLQMLRLDAAMVSSFDPGLQIAENKVDHWQMRLGLIRVAAKSQGIMAISHFGKLWVAGPSVSAHHSAVGDVLFDKACERFSAPVWHDAKPQPSSINAASVLLTIILARPNLYSSNHDRLMVDAATFPPRLAADHALIDFNRVLAADGIALGTNHTGAQLVENLEGCLITSERKLALELNGGLSGNLRGHEVRAPKPRREWRVARLHDGAGRQRRIGLATTAAQHHRRASCETVRLATNAALLAHKFARPTNGLKIAGARRIIWEYPLKLWKGSGEAANVHAQDDSRS